MQRVGVKGIHIAERDTQRAKAPKPRGTFVNTWSVEGFVSEGLQPAELGLGTHEKGLPPNGHRHDFGCGAAIYLAQPGAGTKRALLDADRAGPARLPGHPQRGDLDRRLLHACARAARPCTGRPATTPITPATTRCCRCTRWPATPGSGSRRGKSSTRTRSSTASTSSACCSTATPRTPTGTAPQLSIEETRQLAPYQNATGLQVTSAVLAGIVWMLENPDRGIIEADEMDFRRCLEIQRPYLGNGVRHLHRLDAARGPAGTVSGGDRQERSLAVQQRAGALSCRSQPRSITPGFAGLGARTPAACRRRSQPSAVTGPSPGFLPSTSAPSSIRTSSTVPSA